jgi:hypothetical protein
MHLKVRWRFVLCVFLARRSATPLTHPFPPSIHAYTYTLPQAMVADFRSRAVLSITAAYTRIKMQHVANEVWIRFGSSFLMLH